MKKRALLSTFASLALAGVMCVGFAACGGSGVDAKSVKGEEVTKEQWDAAFDYTKFEETYANFKLEEEVKADVEMTVAGEKKGSKTTMTTTYTFADKKTHVELETKISTSGKLTDEEKERAKASEISMEYYVDESGEGVKFYAEVDGVWKEVENDDNDYTSATEEIMYLVMHMLPSMEYEDWTYSKDDKGYVLKQDEEDEEAEEGMKMVLKFADGKLKAVYVESSMEYDDEEEEESGKYVYTYNYVMTYGGQSVKLPKVAA